LKTITREQIRKDNMSAENNKGYMLLFVGNEWHKGLSPEQMEKISDDWMKWFNDLIKDGRAVAGHPLERGGKIVSGKSGNVVDGPFAESKEAIGGYFLLDVATMDEAVEIARLCPGLPYGAKVEVRAVRPECPLKPEAEAQLAAAKA
jgi:hypothetical protein